MKEPLEHTICFNLGFLYRKSLINKDEISTAVIKECFIMAKKMNRQLLEYKHVADNTTEDDWLEELNSMGKRKIWRVFPNKEIV